MCIVGSIALVEAQERRRKDERVAQGADDTKSTNNQIEMETDRFSNVTTVTLKPQVILDKPDHQLTMEIETKLGEKTFHDWQKEQVMAIVEFESQSTAPIDSGDEELHFVIDGKPLNLGRTRSSVDAYASRYGKLKPGFRIRETYSAFFNRPALEQFRKANRIEMRLGSFEPTLSQSVVANLREYANQVLAQHKIAKERKP